MPGGSIPPCHAFGIGAKTEGNKRQRGVVFFDYFLLDTEKKVIRFRATSTKGEALYPHPNPPLLKVRE